MQRGLGGEEQGWTTKVKMCSFRTDKLPANKQAASRISRIVTIRNWLKGSNKDRHPSLRNKKYCIFYVHSKKKFIFECILWGSRRAIVPPTDRWDTGISQYTGTGGTENKPVYSCIHTHTHTCIHTYIHTCERGAQRPHE